MPRPGPRTDPRSVKADEMNNRGIMVSELKKNQKTTGWRNEVTVDWIGLGEKENKKKNTETQKGDCYGRRQNRGQDWESERSLHL